MMEKGMTFYPVKILSAKGKVKKILTPKSLSQRYWGDFFDPDLKKKNGRLKETNRKAKKKNEAKKDPNMSYEDIYFSED